MIIATQMADNQSGIFAAKICADYSVADGEITYGDWYLPSKYELNLLYLQKDSVGGFSSWWYWSSYEIHVENSWGQKFSDGQVGYTNKISSFYVRAIRAF